MLTPDHVFLVFFPYENMPQPDPILHYPCLQLMVHYGSCLANAGAFPPFPFWTKPITLSKISKYFSRYVGRFPLILLHQQLLQIVGVYLSSLFS